MEKYIGTVIEESLEDNRILNDLEVVSFRISKDDNPADRWHLYKIQTSEEGIDKLSKNIKEGWYAHFWKGEDFIVIFKNKKFTLKQSDKETWKPAVEHGLSLGIPAEQLDFVIE